MIFASICPKAEEQEVTCVVSSWAVLKAQDQPPACLGCAQGALHSFATVETQFLLLPLLFAV